MQRQTQTPPYFQKVAQGFCLTSLSTAKLVIGAAALAALLWLSIWAVL